MKFRVEYFENGTVKAVEASGDNLEDVRAKFHGKKVLAVCVMEDYKALYEKYSDVMNPSLYTR